MNTIMQPRLARSRIASTSALFGCGLVTWRPWLVTLIVPCVLALQTLSASAGVVTLDATQRGFITQTGATNPTNLPAGQRDYLLGNCTLNSCFATGGGEYRNFFGFAIPALSGSVVSAALQIDTVGIDLGQSASMIANFSSLNSTTNFSALGTGTAYGSIAYGGADANTTRSILLDQAAISAILADQGGAFLIGGRAISATTFDPAAPNELVFEHSGPQDATRLVITTREISEPGSIVMVSTSLIGMLLLRLRRGGRLFCRRHEYRFARASHARLPLQRLDGGFRHRIW